MHASLTEISCCYIDKECFEGRLPGLQMGRRRHSGILHAPTVRVLR